jgi:hypothetical protein
MLDIKSTGIDKYYVIGNGGDLAMIFDAVNTQITKVLGDIKFYEDAEHLRWTNRQVGDARGHIYAEEVADNLYEADEDLSFLHYTLNGLYHFKMNLRRFL